MKTRLYLVCGVLLVVVMGGLWRVSWAVRAVPPQAPTTLYDRKPIVYWLTNPTPNFTSGPHLPLSLVSDTNAVPILISALRRDGWFGAAIYRKQIWPKLPSSIQKHLAPSVDNEIVRSRAADFLSRMGPLAEPAIPALIRALKEDDRWEVRTSAASALGTIGKGESAVVTALLEALRDQNATVHSVSTMALGQTGQGNRAAVAALIEALKDKDHDVRLCGAYYLGQIGQANKGNNPTATALTEALKDIDRDVRRAATNSLWQLNPETAGKAGVTGPE